MANAATEAFIFIKAISIFYLKYKEMLQYWGGVVALNDYMGKKEFAFTFTSQITR